MKRIIPVLLLSLPVQAENLPSLPLFTAVCTATQATGFAAERGKWVASDFVPTTFTVRKIDPNKNRPEHFAERSPCVDPDSAADSEYSYAWGCYVISSAKQKTFSFADGERCLERFKDGVIQAVYCDTLTFLPGGKFIRVPDAKDFEPSTVGRDVVVSVGTCMTVVE